MNPGVCSFGISIDSSRYPNSKYECSMRSESQDIRIWKTFNTVLQRCPRFWPLAPPRGINPGVYSLGISEDPPRYLSSKFDASVRSDCWDISIWKTLTQCEGNGNANANANANADGRGDYNSSPCTSYRRANNTNKSIYCISCIIIIRKPSWEIHELGTPRMIVHTCFNPCPAE